jgi:hypothetical protein
MKNIGQLEREIAELRKLVKDLIQPKSRARIIGSSGSTSLFRFTLNASLSTGTADADILQMDGTDTGTDADVLDPLGIFSSLTTGYPGLCIMQAGIYYVIQAPCPG